MKIFGTVNAAKITKKSLIYLLAVGTAMSALTKVSYDKEVTNIMETAQAQASYAYSSKVADEALRIQEHAREAAGKKAIHELTNAAKQAKTLVEVTANNLLKNQNDTHAQAEFQSALNLQKSVDAMNQALIEAAKKENIQVVKRHESMLTKIGKTFVTGGKKGAEFAVKGVKGIVYVTGGVLRSPVTVGEFMMKWASGK